MCVYVARIMRSGDFTEFPPTDSTGSRIPLQKVLQERFRYDPNVRQKALNDGTTSDNGVVKLEPFVVKETTVNPYFSYYATRQRLLAKLNKPSLANGIGLPGLGFKPYNDVFPGDSVSPPIARWTLINFRW